MQIHAGCPVGKCCTLSLHTVTVTKMTLCVAYLLIDIKAVVMHYCLTGTRQKLSIETVRVIQVQNQGMLAAN